MASPEVTQALLELGGGDPEALDRLLLLVSEHLQGLARRELRRERLDQALSPTALVHEAYLQLVELDRVDWRGRARFFGACAQAMRRILISHARMKGAYKRDGGATELPVDNVLVAAEERPGDLVALDEALAKLERLSERQTRVVECRLFAGMGVEDTASALDIAPATVNREWTAARAWLNRELSSG